MENQTPQNPPITEDTKSIITVLVLLTIPPVGVVIMWIWTKWKLAVKSLITACACLPIIAIVLFIVFAVVMGINEDRKPQATNTSSVKVNQNTHGTINLNRSTTSGGTNVYSDTRGGYIVAYSSEDLKNCNEKSYSENLVLFRAPHTCATGDVPYLIRVSTVKTVEDYFEDPAKVTEEKINVDGVEGTKYTYTFDETDGPLMSIGKQTVIMIERPVMDSSGVNPTVVIEMYGDDPDEQVIFNKFLASFKWTGRE